MPHPPQPDAQPTPETLGPYRLLRTLGEGATGTVYLAERTDFNQRVALKVFHPDLVLAGFSAHAGEEARLLALLDHPHIVRTLGQSATADGVRFLVMEYVDGEPAERFADGGRLPLRQRVDLLLQTLDALEYAHRHLVVHRDLKPANLLVTPDGQARLLDFGAAGLMTGRTTPQALTPLWSSPEQRVPGAPVSVANDIYSAGLLARLLLAGVGPAASPEALPSQLFLRLDRTTQDATGAARGTGAAGLARQLRGDLDAILLRSLAENPDRRYGSAALFAADLRRWCLGQPVRARPVSAPERARRWVLRHRLLSAASAAVALLLALSVAGVLWQSGKALAQRRRAESRLQDLVELTGTLDGDLYSSLGPLPGAGGARASLLKDATDTLDSLAAGDHDPALSLQLARQYARLARLQLTEPAAGPANGSAQAARDIARGLELLEEFRRTGRSRQEADSTRAELEALRIRLPAHP